MHVYNSFVVTVHSKPMIVIVERMQYERENNHRLRDEEISWQEEPPVKEMGEYGVQTRDGKPFLYLARSPAPALHIGVID